MAPSSLKSPPLPPICSSPYRSPRLPVEVLLAGDGAPYLSSGQSGQPTENTPAFVPGISYSVADYGPANFVWSSLVQTLALAGNLHQAWPNDTRPPTHKRLHGTLVFRWELMGPAVLY